MDSQQARPPILAAPITLKILPKLGLKPFTKRKTFQMWIWINKIKQEMGLPEVEIVIRRNTTTMFPKESIQVCIEEKVPLFCAGLGENLIEAGFLGGFILDDHL